MTDYIDAHEDEPDAELGPLIADLEAACYAVVGHGTNEEGDE